MRGREDLRCTRGGSSLKINAVSFGRFQQIASALTGRIRALAEEAQQLETLIGELLSGARAAELDEPIVVMHPQEPEVQYLRIQDVVQRVGLSRSTIWNMSSDGRFPAPRNLSGRSVGWLAADVRAWIDSRPRNSALGVARPLGERSRKGRQAAGPEPDERQS
jgi:prophage regulatory protein